eukprot:TRINITY_DN93406_c0_g1_i1.p1 TRINITY_DN93406_c0_g1~~TRINITY_DN93406_c0_g1_i1.p1  ORF type:complete len:247 (-),score=81.48 TRINITY_DN93406_c0_g1_i1:38-778(-)
MQLSDSRAHLPLLASLANRRRVANQDGEEKQRETSKETSKEPKRPSGAKRKVKEKLKSKKGAPQEVSSRKPVAPAQAGAARAGSKVAALRPRDPRFDDMSGNLDIDSFQKAYSFLDDYRKEELETLKKQKLKLGKIAKRKDVDEAEIAEQAESIQQEIKRRVQQDKQRARMGELVAAERALKGEERKKVRETGKVPYFYKRGAVRKIVAEKKREARKGSRSKEEERREKKLAAKEKKRLPGRREHE